MRKASAFNLPGVVLLLILIGLWQAMALRAASPNMPAIGSIAKALWTDAPAIGDELLKTLGRAVAGLLVAVPSMIIAGLVIGRVALIGNLVTPIVDLLRPLPPIAIAPVAMLFAGTGSAAKIAVIAYGCAFPVLINTIDATRAFHPMYNLVAASVGMSRWQAIALVDLPAALPRILTGVRTSVALSLLISVASEMILSSDGLGNLIVLAQQRFEIARELAAIGVIIAVGLLISTLWSAFDRRLIAWHYGYLDRNR